MVKQQIEALRLADCLDDITYTTRSQAIQAAAELRRLHQSETEGWRYADELEQERKRLNLQNQELLEVLKSTGLFLHHCWCNVQMDDYSFEKLNLQMEIVDVIIAKASGE